VLSSHSKSRPVGEGRGSVRPRQQCQVPRAGGTGRVRQMQLGSVHGRQAPCPLSLSGVQQRAQRLRPRPALPLQLAGGRQGLPGRPGATWRTRWSPPRSWRPTGRHAQPPRMRLGPRPRPRQAQVCTTRPCPAHHPHERAQVTHHTLGAAGQASVAVLWRHGTRRSAHLRPAGQAFSYVRSLMMMPAVDSSAGSSRRSGPRG